MATTALLEQGRDAFARRAWSEAYAALQGATEPRDLELLATTTVLLGHDDGTVQPMERAVQGYLAAGEVDSAGRCAFWLGLWLASSGDMARGGGWLQRAQRVVGDRDCAAQGYLLIPRARQDIDEDPSAAYSAFTKAVGTGERFGDVDLTSLARLGQGQSLLRLGRTREGMTLLDEVMVAVHAGEVSPVPSGIIYCAVIAVCQEISDLHRAHEWTNALTEWCAAQPDLVPFRGECLIHRSQILQRHGDWPDAMQEAEQACQRFPSGHPAVGAAHYQRGELHRLRGEFPQAEEAYREASQWGHNPQPGLAQLRLAQGQIDVARAAIQRVLDVATDLPRRSHLLPAYVEIALAADDHASARAGADELTNIAAQLGVPLLDAVAAHVTGAVAVVEGDPQAALPLLQHAAAAWRAADLPYEAGRARVLVGVACHALGDTDSAALELDAARRVFSELGAQPELDRLEQLRGRWLGEGTSADHGLTERELDVLRLLAAGHTNQAIADDLVISTHTVARHVQNIFRKLGVSSRTAAAAFAFERHLV